MVRTKIFNMVLRNIITLMKHVVAIQFVIGNGAVNSGVLFFFNVTCT